jgi:lipopolysaccharide biosynthesis glycosyltransferase
MEQDVLFHCQLKNCIQNRAIEVLKEDCESCEKNNAQEVLNMLLNYQAILITSQHNVSCLKKVIENLLFDCLKGCNGCN